MSRIAPALMLSAVVFSITIAGCGKSAERDTVRQMISLNNLKQLALAMQAYQMRYGHYPAAAVLGKDGKTPHSWRVELLPYLEEMALYNEYHFDEPWDSDHNKGLITKMPAIYRDPFDDPKSTNASYFMPVGKGTFGESEKGTSDFQIRDGSGNTIVLIEAKRNISWTKPEDIEIDPDPTKPIPKLGWGLPSGEFAVAFADGSCRIAADTLDPKLLRSLTTINGGEEIPDDVFNTKVIGKKDAER